MCSKSFVIAKEEAPEENKVFLMLDGAECIFVQNKKRKQDKMTKDNPRNGQKKNTAQYSTEEKGTKQKKYFLFTCTTLLLFQICNFQFLSTDFFFLLGPFLSHVILTHKFVIVACSVLSGVPLITVLIVFVFIVIF